MSAGRVRYLRAGEKGPKSPAFRLRFQGGGELVLTEAGSKKRAGVWLLTPEQAEEELAHLGPEALGLGARAAGRDPRRRLAAAAPAAPRPARARRHRPRLVERDPAHGPSLALRALHTARPGGGRAARRRDRRGARARARAPPPQAPENAKIYRIHDRLGEPCFVCETPIARVDYEEHTIYYCPTLPDRRPRTQGPPAVEAPAVAVQTVSTADGRTLACAEWGDPDGFPVFFLHGSPGSRLWHHYDETVYVDVGARLITYDRPGYGASDRNPGRRVVDCAGDVAAIARPTRNRPVRRYRRLRRRAAFAGRRGAPARTRDPGGLHRCRRRRSTPRVSTTSKAWTRSTSASSRSQSRAALPTWPSSSARLRPCWSASWPTRPPSSATSGSSRTRIAPSWPGPSATT